jgi:hypothetical protein
MQVHPLVPFFSTFIDGISMTVASLDIAAGAAANALLILSASVDGGVTGPTLGAADGLPDCAVSAAGAAIQLPRHISPTLHATVNRSDTFHLLISGRCEF